jgi:hypothetical protein
LSGGSIRGDGDDGLRHTLTNGALRGTVLPHQLLIAEPTSQTMQVPEDTEPLGKVGCQEWLGGVLKHYYRKAA